ncbi:MAG: ATP-binding cassette domain-containing protein [Candidatus Auribacter fodinae]|jgi:lipooligosaccharide transport system ATP-binding protein|uniref:ATP-binding cassette domain-containing protein n=1 Tax=Candidatus Auribacter fodinae TaxID=2093366 RepID=A0A3A4R4M4_9BACT|nr:MAG: ATP-binding cassette domain-containing protein [Candidatus Auribacter fodinae]
MTRTPVIEACGLTKQFNSFTAVDGIDFSIFDSECFGFLGPNGAGKTTTMKMIYCLSPRSSGELSIMGMDPERQPVAIKSMIGVVPQDNNLDPELTVAENLVVYSRFFGIPRKVYKERIEELLEFMSLDKKRNARIKELSGGMKRRLALVRALLNKPRILILDEPTTGLDPQVRHLIWEKLRQLKLSGVTMLLTTHYMEEASQICDRLVIMHEGKILLKGNPHQLVQEHTPNYVMEFSFNGCMVRPEKLAEKYACHIEIYGNRCFVYADSEPVLNQIRTDTKIDTRIIRTSNLEDLFLRLTGRGLHE